MSQLDERILATIDGGAGVPVGLRHVETDVMKTRTLAENVAAVPRTEITSDPRLLLDLLLNLKHRGVLKEACIRLEALVVAVSILRRVHDSLEAIKVVKAGVAIEVAVAALELTGWKGSRYSFLIITFELTNRHLHSRRQQRENSSKSIWPPSPKAPYREEYVQISSVLSYTFF